MADCSITRNPGCRKAATVLKVVLVLIALSLGPLSYGQGKGQGKGQGGGGGGQGGGGNQGLVVGDPMDSQPQRYYFSNDFSLGSDLTIAGPVVIVADGDFNIGNNEVTILSGGSLTLYVKGDMAISGNGGFNNTNRPETLQIWGTATDSQDFTVNGNGTLSAVVYAPKADLQSNGGGANGRILGSMVANSIRFNGSPGPFHFDEALLGMKTEFSRFVISNYSLVNDGRGKVDGQQANPSYDEYLESVFGSPQL